MQDTGERRNKLLLIIVFFGIITAFFYCLIVGTMPKYKSVSSREEIDQTDLSKDYICLDSSVAEVYRGRLYDSSDFAAENAEDGEPDTFVPRNDQYIISSTRASRSWCSFPT